MRNRIFRGTIFLALMGLFLSACSGGADSSAPGVTPAPSPSAGATSGAAEPSATPAPLQTSQLSPTPVAPAENTFSTPDGSLSFTYPKTWQVTPVPGQLHAYAVVDSAGVERATLRDRIETSGYASVATGFDTGFKMKVPGINGAAGEGASIIVHGIYGQAVGGQSVGYALATDGSPAPIGLAGIEVPAGGYFVRFSGFLPLDTATVPPSQEELMASATAFANSESFAETAKVMASLTMNPAKVTAVGCLGFKYKYLELNGISCDDAKAALDQVEKTGTGSGARNMETADFYCFYASYGEKQSGQADVICRHQLTPDAVSFEAWLK